MVRTNCPVFENGMHKTSEFFIENLYIYIKFAPQIETADVLVSLYKLNIW